MHCKALRIVCCLKVCVQKLISEWTLAIQCFDTMAKCRTLRKSALLALPKIVEIGHPGLVEGVVRGILDPYSETKKLAIGMIRTHIPDSLTHEPRLDYASTLAKLSASPHFAPLILHHTSPQ